MPDDATGSYFLPPSYKVQAGDDVLPVQHNPPLEDLAQAMSNRLHKDGRTAWTGNQNANGNRLTGLADAVNPQDAATKAQIDDMGVAIGDGKWSVRDLGSDWLRRDGRLYLRASYPDLADLMPALPDGVLWENKPSGTTMPLTGIAQSPDRFFAIGRDGSGDTSIVASVNGGEWTVRQNIDDFSGDRVAYGGGIYAALGGNGHYSQSVDGDVWSSPALIDSGTVGLTGLAFGNGAFVASGTKDSIRALWRSEDAATWTRVGPTVGSGSFMTVRYLDDRFIAAGTNGAIYHSTDGSTWTEVTTGTSVTINSIAFDGTTYVIVGGAGYIATSATLAGWTVRASGTTQTFNDVVHSSAGFMAVGNGGIVRISSAGTSWAASPSGTSASLSGVIADQNNPSSYIVAGPPSNVMIGARTLPTQFRVPSDDPTYGWIRAK